MLCLGYERLNTVRHDGGATFTGSTIVMKESAAKRSIGTITRCLYDVHIPWSGHCAEGQWVAGKRR